MIIGILDGCVMKDILYQGEGRVAGVVRHLGNVKGRYPSEAGSQSNQKILRMRD